MKEERGLDVFVFVTVGLVFVVLLGLSWWNGDFDMKEQQENWCFQQGYSCYEPSVQECGFLTKTGPEPLKEPTCDTDMLGRVLRGEET